MIFSNQERQNLLIEFPSNLFSFQLCTVCNLWVTTTMSLKRHKKHKHPELYVIEEKLRSELDERKRYKCDICDKKIASYSSLQRHHKLVHNNPEMRSESTKDSTANNLSLLNGFDLSPASRNTNIPSSCSRQNGHNSNNF